MRTAYLCFDDINGTETDERKMALVGGNTGNLVFDAALKRIFPKHIKIFSKEHISKKDDYDALVIHNIIWITENTTLKYVAAIAKEIEKPIIPISIGVQASLDAKSFTFNAECLKVLQALQERAILGVRGERTADFLTKAGIKNIRIIGCPSMFYHKDINFHIEKKPITTEPFTTANFSTFYKKLNPLQEKFLMYLANNRLPFVEQVIGRYKAEYMMTATMGELFGKYLSEFENVFWNIDDWLNFTSKFEFSLGMRFHGNVAAVLSGVPALFFPIDSRTYELCAFFKFPTFNVNKFDDTKPLSYYYKLADYSEFNKNYKKAVLNFTSFCSDNGIKVNFNGER